MAYVIPCVRFNRAVSPSLCLQVSFRISVGDAVSSAIFNGLANTTATLGSFYWLGFETSGLSPDKKRLALLGARRSHSTPDRQSLVIRGEEPRGNLKALANKDQRWPRFATTSCWAN